MTGLSMTVDVRAAEVLAVLRNGERRIRWAIASAINSTLKDAQTAVRGTAEQHMTIRSEFVRRRLAILKFARSSDPAPSGHLYAGAKEGERLPDRLLLPQFEAGGSRGGWVGENVAIPLLGGPARRTKKSRVPKAMEFESLDFKHRGKSIVGARRTYIVPDVGVFQRTGREKRATRMVYLFRPRVSIPAALKFISTSQYVSARQFPGYLRREVDKTLAFHGFSVGSGGQA